MPKLRIDQLIVDKGLAESRSRAQSLVMAGKVYVNGQKIIKSSQSFDPENIMLEVKEDFPYVSRGALKLKQAVEQFGIELKNRIAVDIGSSTGGFTDYLLQNGTQKVYAVDAGINQLAYKLRSDPKVVVMEKTNARYLEKTMFNPLPDLAVIDVSFISLKLILPAVKTIGCTEVIGLIKPQFEVGKEVKHFDGVVKNPEDRQKAIEKVKSYSHENGFVIIGITDSPIEGPKGNKEFLIYLKLPE